MTFALYFGNRGFMPAELIEGAREDMVKAVTDAGYDYIMMDKESTRYGAVETRDEGRIYAKWLKSHEGEYDGVILCMPIFVDENGAIAALQDAGVPILMQAYPDEIGKMDFQHRRDAYCGKFSVTEVFEQYRVPYTVMTPHVVHPLSAEFTQNLHDFAGVCRVVNGMKRFTIGCIGARTTAFKTVRFDELTMQRHGINVESFGINPQKLYAMGGGAYSDVWLQIKADILNRPVTALLAKEAGTCGTCMMTGVAVGVYKDLYDAKEAFVKEKQTFVPNKDKAEVYKQYYNAYKNIYNAVRPIIAEIEK